MDSTTVPVRIFNNCIRQVRPTYTVRDGETGRYRKQSEQAKCTKTGRREPARADAWWTSRYLYVWRNLRYPSPTTPKRHYTFQELLETRDHYTLRFEILFVAGSDFKDRRLNASYLQHKYRRPSGLATCPACSDSLPQY